MKKFKVGDKVRVIIRENGYWKDLVTGTFLAETEKRYKIKTVYGVGFYSKTNIREKN